MVVHRFHLIIRYPILGGRFVRIMTRCEENDYLLSLHLEWLTCRHVIKNCFRNRIQGEWVKSDSHNS